MNTVSSIVLLIFIASVISTCLVGAFGRNSEVNFAEFFMAGSSIYRNPKKYIDAKALVPFMILSYTAVGSFIAFLVIVLFMSK